MATAHIAFGGAMSAGAPVFPTKPRAAESITTSGTTQSTTIEANQGEYAHITASGGSIFIAIGETPTAASGSGWLVSDGETRTCGVLKQGEKVAVIDV